jgi:predicted SAM-dependent methyltransferase
MSERTITITKGSESQVMKVIEITEKYINEDMNGIDIGSGGSPIFINSISMDIKTRHWSSLIQLHGDARNLYWFKDEVLDYVFSSHCWEDFSESEKIPVLKEWIRVVKPGGFLILVLPDEQKYRNYCANRGAVPNGDHKDATFSMEKVIKIVSKQFPNLKIIEATDVTAYSFIVVFKKS